MEGSKTSRALAVALAETYALMVKTQGYHWNVVGPYFKELHDLFQVQYEELFLAVDEIAEQLRACGATAPNGLAQLAALSTMKEGSAAYDDQTMLEDLAASNEVVQRACRDALRAAEAVGDDATMDLMTTRVRAHAKAVWMLRSSMQVRAAKAAAAPAPPAEAPKAKKKKPKEKAAKAAKAQPAAVAAAPAVTPGLKAASGRPKPSVKASG